MTILITGGHITPALAVIEELERRDNVEIVVVGRKYALDHEKSESFEYKTLKEKGIRFINLPAGRLTRLASIQSMISLLKLPNGFLAAFKILRREKPDKILSFGGYIALPVAQCAYFLGIPVYTHEQTMRAGLTNKIIAAVAKKIFVSFKQTQDAFPRGKTFLTGNPVRHALLDDLVGGATEKTRSERQNLPSRPVLYITGGSLGSHSINVHIENILDELTKTFTVIHQTGSVEQFGDYERLKKRASSSYIVMEHVSDEEIGKIYAQADLVISRSGANTVSELIILEKPSVLIPLPWSSNGEQYVQAAYLQKAGVAEGFDQKEDSSKLLELIQRVYVNRKEYEKKFSTLSADQKLIEQAAAVIADQVLA